MELVIASDLESDDLFVEIQGDGQPWAEIRYDRAREAYTVTLFPLEGKTKWPVLDLAEFWRALARAKQILVEKGYPDLKLQ